jgi:hypothetical protein
MKLVSLESPDSPDSDALNIIELGAKKVFRGRK